MAVMTDQFAEWRAAMCGGILDCGPPGEPTSGYFKRVFNGHPEAVAIWRDGKGQILCKIYSDVPCAVPFESSDPDEIDEILSWCSRYPISYEMFYKIAYEGGQFPPEYSTRLTGKEVADGTPWTPHIGREKIAAARAREDRRAAEQRAKDERRAAREEKRRAKSA